MAITKVTRLPETEGSALQETWRFKVITDSATTSAASVRTASAGGTSIPADGSLLAGTLLYAKSEARQSNSEPFGWDVVTTFSPKTGASKPAPPVGQTTSKWNASLSARALPYACKVSEDKDGDPILNAAGFPFKEQPMSVGYDAEYTVSFTTDNGAILAAIVACIGRRNSAQFTLTINEVVHTFNANTCRMTDYSYSIDDAYAEDTYWKVSVSWVWRGDGMHDLELENSGFYDIDGNAILDTHGNPKSEPTLLNSTGDPLADTSTAEPLVFELKASTDFATMFGGL